jgi:hypothetical protein
VKEVLPLKGIRLEKPKRKTKEKSPQLKRFQRKIERKKGKERRRRRMKKWDLRKLWVKGQP